MVIISIWLWTIFIIWLDFIRLVFAWLAIILTFSWLFVFFTFAFLLRFLIVFCSFNTESNNYFTTVVFTFIFSFNYCFIFTKASKITSISLFLRFLFFATKASIIVFMSFLLISPRLTTLTASDKAFLSSTLGSSDLFAGLILLKQDDETKGNVSAKHSRIH